MLKTSPIMRTRRLCKGAATSEAGPAPAGIRRPRRASLCREGPSPFHGARKLPALLTALGKKETNQQNQKKQTRALSSESFWGSAGLCPLFNPSFLSLAWARQSASIPSCLPDMSTTFCRVSNEIRDLFPCRRCLFFNHKMCRLLSVHRASSLFWMSSQRCSRKISGLKSNNDWSKEMENKDSWSCTGHF